MIYFWNNNKGKRRKSSKENEKYISVFLLFTIIDINNIYSNSN